ncbi:hypothetical protein CFBP5507_25920 (plasmid) [Agrobacterium salinitolerans]|uniref:Uncharacterized protein n=1 Tax=Agrobacterium salinitolerans TaxID=1183413 RepID=A0A4Z1QUQ2_9HYPH|nr:MULTISPECIES: hypothetical protein [Agrobacterium]MDH6298230.1 hypothetical protein [Agrobacterium fabrum]UYZ10952.1 hypothetical protein CFBP5507_25920 [Agrobacterium salinitolerans]
MSAIAYPYLRIEDAEVLTSPWAYKEEDRRTLGNYLPDWDYASEIRLYRKITVDVPRIAKRFGVSDADLRLRLVITVGTGGAREDRYRRVYWAHDIARDEADHEVEFSLDGLDISQRIRLRTDLLYSAPGVGGSILAPKRTGLSLWDDETLVRVEPEEARFPVEAVSFSQHFPDTRNAMWRLEWSPADLTEDFTGSFRVFINDDFPDFVSKMSAGEITTVGLVKAAVRVQVTRGALSHNGLEDALKEESQVSIASAVQRWLTAAFPGESIATIRQIADHNPALFDAAISGVYEERVADA